MKTLDPSASARQQKESPLPVQPVIYPLDSFYAADKRPLPSITAVQKSDIPEPYRRLLVHDVDMTSTLEKFHGGRLVLDILLRDQRDDFYFRASVLVIEETGRRAEFGAIRINLGLFKPDARRLILAGHLPLGRILAETRMEYSSRPKAFLRMTSDAYINSALRLEGAQTLYGRRNTLCDPDDRALAEIVEILPP